jgi:nicotinate-nucleotide adenylyltransferase
VTHWRESSGLGADELGWLIGMDSLRELHTWHRVAELVDACTIVTASRPGHTPGDLGWLQPTLTAGQIERLRRYIVAGPLIDIAATDIRRRVAAGQSVRYLVPEQVARQIRERGLYRPAAE